ncbi:MAG TPA: hypothetical protein VN688_24330 [Gemmataceae bacterium]|nr:hypothetical protein [Gemmataceae bacterium]
MNAATNTQASAQDLEQERRRIAHRLEEVAKLSESNVPPGAFYGEMLKRLLESLAAPAGAIWARTAQGNLQMQCQINVKDIGLDQNEDARKTHEELLRQAIMSPRAFHLPPRSAIGVREEGKPAAGNPTDYLLLVAPILVNQQPAGLIEVWQAANRPPQAINGYMQYMTLMAELASRYQRNQLMGQLAGQQQVWTQLEAFARQVHNSLHPTEVAYVVANEGRRLVECDRVTVALRHYGAKARIEAVSGADVVERRSNLVRLMRTLCERVLTWGEKLIFSGTRDDSLPPKVLAALDAYLAESNSKLLVVQPLRDERETSKRPPRSALLMECFEPPAEPQQLIARLDVVARHATPALYNAVEHRRIPGRMLWMPLAKVQEGIGGKAKAISAVAVALLSLLGAAFYFVPYELKMETNGKLVPWARRVVYPPTTGKIEEFKVEPGDVVVPDRQLANMYSLELEQKLSAMFVALTDANNESQLAENSSRRLNLKPDEKINYREKADMQKKLVDLKRKEFDEFLLRNFASPDRPKWGEFELRAPQFTTEEKLRVSRQEWTVLNGNFKDEWLNRTARPSEALLRLGAKDGPWEIEFRIPQKHISQVLRAYERNGGQALDIDFLLRSDPTRNYRGKLYRDKIASEAVPNRDEKDESEPEVIAFASIDDPAIDPAYRLSRESLTSGTEVHAKIRCGKQRLGYALFYGVWEFIYEKVVFFF